MEKLFFGIDGGGTKSRLGIMNGDGTLLHTIIGFSTNMYAVGFETVCSNIRFLFRTLQSEYGISAGDFAAGCFASAGVSTEKEKEMFRSFFIEENILCPLFICNDALAALAGGTGKAEGLIVISGTGSVAAALRRDGESCRAGGLGHLISDEGSGFTIGLEGIKTAVKAFEGRSEHTLLTDMLFKHYKTENIRELFSFLYINFDKSRIASFAPCVFDAWRLGDAAAVRIVDAASNELALLAESVYTRLFSDKDKRISEKTFCCEHAGVQAEKNCTQNTTAVFSGGIFEHEAEFSRHTADLVHKLLPCVTVRERLYEPVQGACILARHVCESGEVLKSS